ncbi:hypothetical protein D3C76_1087870 [compost metagenome]|uniref:DUF4227 domain-containing protein n=2 Tax=Fontibacillus TaxID=995014 RepID=A0A1G7SJP1_9BACL|nr:MULTISPECIES: DUF4227 family protein [Fontibacillus]MBA9085427.1 translation elongation factor EF-Tu-like GTPase [Fontibacillus solani]SDG22470.1 Protein of unknown function [Fontibacillus panacisegetis]
MVISLRKWLGSAIYAIIFIVLAYVMYQMLGLLDEYVFTLDKYRVPEGSAVKAFQTDNEFGSRLEEMSDRLKLFLWYGE